MDMSAIFADFGVGLSTQFSGPLKAGSVVRTSAPTTDDGGSIVTPGIVSVADCSVQVENVTEAMRQADGYSDEDMRLLVLASTLEGTVDTDADIEVLEGPYFGRWSVASVASDPFGTYWDCRGRRTSMQVSRFVVGATNAIAAAVGSLITDARLAGAAGGVASVSAPGRLDAKFVGASSGVSSTSGAPHLWVPSDLFADASTGGWWDASDTSTLFADTAMTTPAALNGAVAAVRDKSGNGNTLLQATLAKRPILRQSADGRYYLAFDGVSHYMGASFTMAQPLSRALHFRLPSPSTATQMICDGYYAAASGTVNTQAQLQRLSTGSPSTNTSHTFLMGAGSLVGCDLGHIPIGVAETAFLDFNNTASAAVDDDWPALARSPGTTSPNGIIIAGRAGFSGTADQLAKLDFFGCVQIGRLLTTTEKRQVQAWNEARRPADLVETIFTCGDSILNTPTLLLAVPEKIRQLWVTNGITNLAIYNENVSSSRTYNAASKVGGIVTNIALTGNSLPAAISAVAATIIQPDGGSAGLSGPLALVTNTGVSGVLTTNDGTQVAGVLWATSSGVYNFTRDVAGTGALAVSSGASFQVTRHRRTSVKRIVCTATNNVQDARAIADVDAIMAQGSDAFLVGPTMPNTTFPGSAAYIANRAYCATQSAKYGARFFDWWAYALNTGPGGWWQDMSMVPDSFNQSDIDAGIMPRLLLSDASLHPSDLATTGFAAKIYSMCHAIGWW